MNHFKNPEYLKYGNRKQQLAFKELNKIQLFTKLAVYDPVLCGTIPIAIDLPESDLDIVCYCKNLETFENEIIEHFSSFKGFSINRKIKRNKQAIICRFNTTSFLVELYGQNTPSVLQEAYRHLLIEAKILKTKGDNFRNEVIKLKKLGIKTEPAFAKLLGLSGDPYEELLNYTI